MSQYFPEPYERSNGNVKVKLDLSNYAMKANLKRPTGVDTSMLASRKYLNSLKIKEGNLDVDKLDTIPTV